MLLSRSRFTYGHCNGAACFYIHGGLIKVGVLRCLGGDAVSSLVLSVGEPQALLTQTAHLGG